MSSKDIRIAWILAIFSISVLWGLGNLAVGFSSKVLEANAMIYTCSLFISAAWVLLAYAGHGALSKETLRSVDTWGYGLVLIVSFLLSFEIFSLVTAAEGALLQRSSIVASLIASWLFLSRSTGRWQILGSLIVLGGVLWVCAGVQSESKATLYGLVFLFSFLQAARVFIAEFHKPHKVAVQTSSDPKARSRVIGYVMFVVAMLFLALSLIGALIHMQTGQLIMGNMPTLQDFTHPESIFFGLVVGALIIAPIRYIEFASSHVIKSENYLALAALAPFSTLFWEWATQPLTGLSLKEFTQNDLLAGLIITAGGVMVAFGAVKNKKNDQLAEYLSFSGQDTERIYDSREILANTLEHFGDDLKKTADALDVPLIVLQAILKDKDKVIAFKPEALSELSRNYRRKVAMSDALTGLANRAGFMTALKGAAYEADVYSILFIDLNKFKPVNDTYGHDAGDAILKGVAERLTALFPKRALTTRLGGDEFAILLLDSTKEQAQAHVDSIKESLSTPFDFNGTDIEIGASVGISTYPEDGTNPEALLKLADEGMYEEKTDR